MSKNQTEATKKWQEKAGYKVCSYKLKAELAEDFKETCLKTGRSQASVISELMKSFIKENR